MKTSNTIPFSRRRQRGYTLVEALMSMSIFGLVVAGVMTCHLVGLRFNLSIQSHIQNVQAARQTLSCMTEEVQAANSLQVGTGTLTNFVPAGATNAQTGNALRIYTSTNLTQYIYYFYDGASSNLYKVSFMNTNPIPVAASVTNSSIFAMEDFTGTVLTNSQNNAVMRVLLQMSVSSPTCGVPDGYQAGAEITRRNLL